MLLHTCDICKQAKLGGGHTHDRMVWFDCYLPPFHKFRVGLIE